MELEDFKKKYEKEINHALCKILLNAVTGELQRVLDNDRRFLAKIRAIINRINEGFNWELRKLFKIYKGQGLQAMLSEIEDIGLYLDSPDLRGLHRKIPLPELSTEYYQLLNELKAKVKRKYRTPAAKKLALKNILELPEETIEGWINLPLNEIAMRTLASRCKASLSLIKKALTRERASVAMLKR
jgi:hypothetical protein